MKDLSVRVQSLKKTHKNEPKKGDLEGMEAARYCGSPYVERGGGDVAFGEDAYIKTLHNLKMNDQGW